MQRGFGGVVWRAPYIGHDASYGARLDDCAFPFNQEWYKLPAHLHDSEDVGLEKLVQLRLVVVKRRDNVVPASIVVQDVELAIRHRRDALAESSDRFIARELEGQVGDIGMRRRVLGRIAHGAENLEACMCEVSPLRSGVDTVSPRSANSRAR